jgi:hypothetical protein
MNPIKFYRVIYPRRADGAGEMFSTAEMMFEAMGFGPLIKLAIAVRLIVAIYRQERELVELYAIPDEIDFRFDDFIFDGDVLHRRLNA